MSTIHIYISQTLNSFQDVINLPYMTLTQIPRSNLTRPYSFPHVYNTHLSFQNWSSTAYIFQEITYLTFTHFIKVISEMTIWNTIYIFLHEQDAHLCHTVNIFQDTILSKLIQVAKVKSNTTTWKPTYNFLYVYNAHLSGPKANAFHGLSVGRRQNF